MNKNKPAIFICIALAAIALIAALILSLSPSKAPEADTMVIHLQTAQQYLVELDYDRAIAEFEAVIQIDPMNVEAYIGLARAYEGKGDIGKAIEVLEKGYEITGSDEILAELERLKAKTEPEPTETTTITTTEVMTTAEETTTETTTVTTTEVTSDNEVTTSVETTSEPLEDFYTIGGEEYSTALTELNLSDKGLTDEDIKVLSKFTNLQKLFLNNNTITDITPLANLTNLNHLTLWNNQISDITPLANLDKLQILELGHNQISDATPLAELPCLGYLGLCDNQIVDVSPIAKLKTIDELDLSRNQISDISSLSELNISMRLLLDDNDISDEDIEWLREQLSNSMISH